MKRLCLLLIAVLAMSAACGSSEGASDEATESTIGSDADATSAEVETETEPESTDSQGADLAALKEGLGSSAFSFALEAIDQECIGSGVVAELGEARLTELGVTAANARDFDPALLTQMSDAERDAMVEVTDDCLDLRSEIADIYGAGDPAITECAYDIFSDEDARSILRSGMNPDQDTGFDVMVDVFTKADQCLALENSEMVGDGTSNGDDASSGDEVSMSDEAVALAIAIAAAGDDGSTTVEEGQCFGREIVASYGVDRFAEMGITSSNAEDFSVFESGLTSEELDTYVEVFSECSDETKFVLDWLVGEATDRACLGVTLTDDDAQRFLRSFISAADDAMSVMPSDVQAKIDACTA